MAGNQPQPPNLSEDGYAIYKLVERTIQENQFHWSINSEGIENPNAEIILLECEETKIEKAMGRMAWKTDYLFYSDNKFKINQVSGLYGTNNLKSLLIITDLQPIDNCPNVYL